MKIIGFTGAMGSGKSAAAEIVKKLVGEKRAGILKFAQPLYEIQEFIQAKLNLPKTKDRKLLQFLGTEWGRSQNGDIWVDAWKNTFDQMINLQEMLVADRSWHVDVVVADDCRFENEAKAINEKGGILVEVVAPREVRASRIELKGEDHASEQGVPRDSVRYVVINDGTLEQLEEQLKIILSNEGVRFE